MKKILLMVILSVIAANSVASNAVTEAYLRGKEPKLNAQEKKAVELAKKWRSSDDSTKPIFSPDGSVSYYYGMSQPVMICAPMEVCIIKLEPGEIITTLQGGDNIRWLITPAVIGTPEGLSRSEVIIKPTEVGLISSLYIGTDRRSYHIKLKSSRIRFVPMMSFLYPQNMKTILAKYDQIEKIRSDRGTLSVSNGNQHIEDLDFDYEITGEARWKPERVYNDGIRTIIQMPKTVTQGKAPVLLVLDESGDESLVNSRLINNRFIVDQVFSEAILITGVGSKQIKVQISKIGEGN